MRIGLDKKKLRAFEQRLDRKKKEIPAAAQRELKTAMPKAGGQLVGTARALVGKNTGSLSAAIRFKVTHGGLRLQFMVNTASLRIPMNAIWQEFGTRKMPANPYFYASWRVNRRKVRGRVNRAIRKGIRKVWGK